MGRHNWRTFDHAVLKKGYLRTLFKYLCTVSCDPSWFENIIPAFQISVNGQCSTFALGATNSQLSFAQLLACNIKYVELCFVANLKFSLLLINTSSRGISSIRKFFSLAWFAMLASMPWSAEKICIHKNNFQTYAKGNNLHSKVVLSDIPKNNLWLKTSTSRNFPVLSSLFCSVLVWVED